MAFLCQNKDEALKLKKKYLKEGKTVKISDVKGKAFIDGKVVKYAVNIMEEDSGSS